MNRTLPPDLPGDWHERLTGLLSSDGVTPIAPVTTRKWLAATGSTLGCAAAGGGAGVLALFLISVAVFQNFGAVWGILGLLLTGLAGWRWIRWLGERFRRWHALRRGRRATMSLRKTAGPPVLLLRSFAFDELSRNPRLVRLAGQVFTFGPVGLEESLVEITSRFAGVLAIGRPGEPEPPLGAARFYVRHDRWQEAIAELVPLCRLVIWATGTTEGLHWEIRHLVAHLAPERLVLWVHVHLLNIPPEARAELWRTFLDRHQDVFPKPLPREVEQVAFIAFDREWNPRPVAAGAHHRLLRDKLS